MIKSGLRTLITSTVPKLVCHCSSSRDNKKLSVLGVAVPLPCCVMRLSLGFVVRTMVDGRTRNIQKQTLIRDHRPVRTPPAKVHPNSLFCRCTVLSSNEKIHVPSSANPTSLIGFTFGGCGEDAGVHVPSSCLSFSLCLTSDTCDRAFHFSVPSRLRMLVPAVSCLMTVLSEVSTLTLEVLQLVHRNPCLCDFLCLSCSNRICISPSLHSWTELPLPSDHHRVFWCLMSP